MSRMVDADALILAFCNGLCGSDPEQCGVMDADRHEGCVLRKYIENAPAIDVAPVIHAHWIEYYTDIMCSHCHATYKDEIVDMYQDGVDHRRYVGLEYCPHCGALMDGGV